jgi:oligoribonuclease
LNILAQGPVIAVHQSDAALAAMDDWNQLHHGQSGLIERVKASTIDDAEAERLTIEFLQQWVPANTSPICGNSIGQDRRFLVRYMPKLEAYFHYRNIDVSTLKELAARWAPALKDGFKKQTKHQALDDIIESIEELRYYREHFIKF